MMSDSPKQESYDSIVSVAEIVNCNLLNIYKNDLSQTKRGLYSTLGTGIVAFLTLQLIVHLILDRQIFIGIGTTIFLLLADGFTIFFARQLSKVDNGNLTNIDQPVLSPKATSDDISKSAPDLTRSKNRDPAKILLDLRLPKAFLNLLSPPLQRLRLTLTEDVAQHEYTSIERQYTVVRNEAGQSRALLYIPGRLLDKANLSNINAISNIGSAFPRGSVLIIFSNTSRVPAQDIRKIIKKQWADERNIRVIFVPWRDVEELRDKDAKKQEQWFNNDLELQELVNGIKKSMSVQQMEGNDTETLVKILKKLPQLIDEPGRGGRTLLQSAGLDEIVGEFNLTGTARMVAWEQVDQLKRRARLPEYPDYEVLGLLLCYILTLEDLPQKDKVSIKQIIRKYALVPPSQSGSRGSGGQDRKLWPFARSTHFSCIGRFAELYSRIGRTSSRSSTLFCSLNRTLFACPRPSVYSQSA
jgi:Effector-associated domain 8